MPKIIITPENLPELSKEIFVCEDKDIRISKNHLFKIIAEHLDTDYIKGTWEIACPTTNGNTFNVKIFHHDFIFSFGKLELTRSYKTSGEEWSGSIYGDLNYLKNMRDVYTGEFFYRIVLTPPKIVLE